MKKDTRHTMTFISKKIFLFLFIIQPYIANSQDSIKARESQTKCYYDKLSCKISSLIISGEIPLIVEYRPIKRIGNVFSVGYTYLNPIEEKLIFFDALFCNGYNLRYGIRFYVCTLNKEKTSWFYISPGIFYKQIWIDNIQHTDFHDGPGSGTDSRLTYYYNFNKQVIGGQLLFGFAIKRNFEIYFGFGGRNIKSNKKY